MRRKSVAVKHPATGVVLTGASFTCTRCKQTKPAEDFGLRTMGTGEVRNQPQCIACRCLPPINSR